MLPKKMDLWIARNWENAYSLLWYIHLVRNEPPLLPPPPSTQLTGLRDGPRK